MSENKYIERLERIKESVAFKEGYKLENSKMNRREEDLYAGYRVSDKDIEKMNQYEKGRMISNASELMSKSLREKNSSSALTAAKIYESFGYGNRSSVKNRLVKALEEEKNKNHYFYKETLPIAMDFIKRNSGDQKKDISNKVLGIGAIAGFVFSLFFLSSNVTGNVIGNAGLASNNAAGIITLIASFLLAFLALNK